MNKKLNKKFTQNDWNHMHDCIYDATWNTTKRNCSKEELVSIFVKLPSELKREAYDFGMSDTLWRDKFRVWYLENIEKLPNTTILTGNEIWNEENINKVKDFINKDLNKLSPQELKERKIFLELLAKKYKEEDESRA